MASAAIIISFPVFAAVRAIQPVGAVVKEDGQGAVSLLQPGVLGSQPFDASRMSGEELVMPGLQGVDTLCASIQPGCLLGDAITSAAKKVTSVAKFLEALVQLLLAESCLHLGSIVRTTLSGATASSALFSMPSAASGCWSCGSTSFAGVGVLVFSTAGASPNVGTELLPRQVLSRRRAPRIELSRARLELFRQFLYCTYRISKTFIATISGVCSHAQHFT